MATSRLYQIRVQGRLDTEWSVWFDGLVITNKPNGEAVLTGPAVDKWALHGILSIIRDLGLPLLSVNQEPSAVSDRGQPFNAIRTNA